MAVVLICCKMPYKDQTPSVPKATRQNNECVTCGCIPSHSVFGFFSSIYDHGIGFRRQYRLCNNNGSMMKAKTRRDVDIPRGISSSTEKQIRSLDSYFGKLNGDAGRPSSSLLIKKEELLDESCQFGAKTGLGALDDYLEKLGEGMESKTQASSASSDEMRQPGALSVKGFEKSKVKKIKNRMDFKNMDREGDFEGSYDETSDLYLISILASINIAVFLFEIASPIRNSDLELFSLPLAYGAKINHLIMIGEWWRLVTPMFLHSGIFHVALSCWGLLTFGPQVCRAYGSFTFLLIYILGGISGNLISFLHTPELTVGGTGPVFGVIGAWFIYQIQNKELIEKDRSEIMIQKAILASAFSYVLSNFGPIDDWTHFGAAFTGIAYGFLTSPTLQMDDASSKSGQEDRITLVRRYADPCKSVILFFVLILVLSSLLLVIEPPLNSLAMDTLV